jgi:hypothetical protein
LGSWAYHITSEYEEVSMLDLYKYMGLSLRLVNNSTLLTDGQTGEYYGNDGKTYQTICIGTQEWLAVNLSETVYRNSSPIPRVQPASDWGVLITGAYCIYEKSLAEILGYLQEQITDMPADHTQNTDTALDTGGANEVTAAQAKTAYSHSQAAHAPSNAQKNSDILKTEIEAVLTGEITTHTHASISQQQIEGLI